MDRKTEKRIENIYKELKQIEDEFKNLIRLYE